MKKFSCFAYFVLSLLLQSFNANASSCESCLDIGQLTALLSEPFSSLAIPCGVSCASLAGLLCINISDLSVSDAQCVLEDTSALQSCSDCLLAPAASYYLNPTTGDECSDAQLPGYAKVTQCYSAYLSDRLAANLNTLTTPSLEGTDSGAVSEPEDAPDTLPNTLEECKDLLGLYGCAYFLGDQAEFDNTASINRAKTCANSVFSGLDALFASQGVDGPINLESITTSTNAADYGNLQGLIERCENITGVPEYFEALIAPRSSPASRMVFSMTGLLITAIVAINLN